MMQAQAAVQRTVEELTRGVEVSVSAGIEK
jgi:hypothetical protein